MKYPKLISAEVFRDYVLRLHYEGGAVRYYDFAPNLDFPAFSELKARENFARFRVVDGRIEWFGGEDFCPFTLYEQSFEN